MRIRIALACIYGALAIGLVLAFLGPGRAAEEPVRIPPPTVDEQSGDAATAVAVLAGGCFWGVQAVFQHVDGVLKAVSGYAGGTRESATYDAVSGGRTRHAEAVEITYDPERVSFGELLHVYFSVVHDPTQLNRQGPDFGPQYRSTIFAANGEQRLIAERYIAELDGSRLYPRPIVTTIEDGQQFYAAETYHQDYLVRNPKNPYIVINDMPKVEALHEIFPELWHDKPTLVLGATQANAL
jgi:peptide-methionine (S)-S-oxide reductase